MTVKNLRNLHQLQSPSISSHQNDQYANSPQTPLSIKDGDDIIAGLSGFPKSLPAQYFYDDRGSALFEQICELPEYYPTRTEAWILQNYADQIAEITGCCELVELGSGSSSKTHYLLSAYQKASVGAEIPEAFSYIPIDVSGGILKTTVLDLQQQYPDLTLEGLIATYDEALVYLGKNHLRSRMIFFLGSSIGNFNESDSNAFLEKVAHALTKGDYFLLGVDLQKSVEILEAAYNDRQGITAQFNLNMLAHLNWRFHGDFDLSLFKHQAIYNKQACQIEMYLHSQSEQRVCLDILDFQVSFAKDESLLTEISRKFDLEQLQCQLRSQGLKTIQVWTDPQQWFGLILCQAW